MSLILASVSPRRRKLLAQIGLTFSVCPSHVDETLDPAIPPEDHVRILARRKAHAVVESAGMHATTDDPDLVVAADTIVVLEGRILNKPLDAEEAVSMLTQLSGRRHEVFTGFSVQEVGTGREITDLERTEVWFRVLDDDEIRRYVASGSPMDKAGAYGIQDDFGAVFIEKIHGDYYNVVGFPLCRFWTVYTDFLKERDRVA